MMKTGTLLSIFFISVCEGDIFTNDQDSDVISAPVIHTTIFVSSLHGSDDSDGLSLETPVASLKWAGSLALSGTRIWVMDGEYRNAGYGTGSVDNQAVMAIRDLTDILVTSYPGHSPVIRFDGVGGIQMNNVERVEISGFEIIGPNNDITYEEAMEDRLIKNKMFIGRGIVAWSGNNINIHHNNIHHCPHSGIRVDHGDYIAIEDNIVHSNTWWGSSAESAVVIAEATNIDNVEEAKIFLQRNEVYDNRNFIPFFNEGGVNTEDHARPDYGTEAQTYIIDGSGVYVTRNTDTYKHGRMWLKDNKAYNNGINGLVVHKTDRAHVVGNVIWDNGQVPKSAPESRQAYAGLTLNHATNVVVRDNMVKTELHQDYAFMACCGANIVGDSRDNKNCKVSKEEGTGYGKVESHFHSYVSSASWSECMEAQN